MLAFERLLQYAKNALQLVIVALDGGRNLLGVEVCKPSCLSEVWALSADLKGQPLIAEVALLESIVAELVRCVVLRNEVLNDGTALP